jgi:lysozyme
MKVNDDGMDIIKRFEGLVDGDPSSPEFSPYLCPSSIPTIGYGTTRYRDGTPIRMGDPGIMVDEAEDLLAVHCDHAEYWVYRCTSIDVSENNFSALVSLVYNIVIGNFHGFTVRQRPRCLGARGGISW